MREGVGKERLVIEILPHVAAKTTYFTRSVDALNVYLSNLLKVS